MAVAPLIVFPDPDSLGPAHLKVAGLELWVHDRRSPKAQDYWEGNWLVVTARCAATGANVWSTGPMLRVPDDISIIGFDDVAPAAFSTPALTTIRQPMEAMGTTAVQLVIDSIRAAVERREANVSHHKVAPELVIRESTKPLG